MYFTHKRNEESSDPRKAVQVQKNMHIDVRKRMLDINRAALSQNSLRTDQLKHSSLARAIDHIWGSMEARQKATSRLGSIAVSSRPTRINRAYKLNANV